MGRVVLDTSILIALERQELLMKDVFKKENEYLLPEMTVAEYLIGHELSTNPKFKAQRLSFLDVLEQFSVPVKFDRQHASAFARLAAQARQQGKPRGNIDMAIAASAVARDAILYTRDSKARFADLLGVTVKEF